MVPETSMPASKKNTIPGTSPAKPFLKWAGGKRQLLPYFMDSYPPALKTGAIKNYYEPFLGSGAVFFDVAQRYAIEHAFLFDVNPELVLTYRVIQSQVNRLAEVLSLHEKKFLALSRPKRLVYFYEQRAQFNQQHAEAGFNKAGSKGIARAAQLIFLNRTCYNGLFRVNSGGAFNTPAGDYAKPVICDLNNLTAVSALLDKATIKQADFRTALKNTRPSSFVYLDPPYRPLSKTASFTAYSKSAFQDKQQIQLARIYRRLNEKGAALMLSNSDTPDGFFDKLYNGFAIERVPARRLINADASKRGHVNEIVVTNYPLK